MTRWKRGVRCTRWRWSLETVRGCRRCMQRRRVDWDCESEVWLTFSSRWKLWDLVRRGPRGDQYFYSSREALLSCSWETKRELGLALYERTWPPKSHLYSTEVERMDVKFDMTTPATITSRISTLSVRAPAKRRHHKTTAANHLTDHGHPGKNASSCSC
jgi:hypothetical protein